MKITSGMVSETQKQAFGNAFPEGLIVSLEGCDLTGVSFRNTVLDDTFFRGAKGRNVSFVQAEFVYSQVNSSTWKHCDFGGADLSGSDCTNMRVTGCSFDLCEFDGCNFAGSTGLPTETV